ncbi:hypothetical protein [Celeribacter indicus]|uniref:Uncharacterized protein n=1 Tax=Celeribacter indicus TaxID=1208324 RepID=A0A0B5DVW8_9RHOB|nr:hypothetical protein [Celeribacter indicus]AJE47139.1 hypothetical protein P73_2424 [Celeribacter indicus]
MKEIYPLWGRRIGIGWHGRKYRRSNPGAADLPTPVDPVSLSPTASSTDRIMRAISSSKS